MTAGADRDLALTRVGGSEKTLAAVLEVFAVECPGLVAAIRRAIDQRSSEELERAAHTLKGSADILGGTGVVETALKLEQLGRVSDFEQAAPLFSELEERVEQMLAAIQGWSS